MRVRETKKQAAVARAGFTLMEVLVVVAIIVIMAGAAVPIMLKYLEDSKKDKANIEVKAWTTVVLAYYTRYQDWPPSLEALTVPAPDGGLPSMMPSSLLDPWNQPYEYAAQGQHNAQYGKPDIWSNGPPPHDATKIIGNWSVLQGVGGQ